MTRKRCGNCAHFLPIGETCTEGQCCERVDSNNDFWRTMTTPIVPEFEVCEAWEKKEKKR